MFSEILSHIRTKDEAKILSNEIDLLMDALYKEGGAGFESTLHAKVRSWVSEEMQKDWGDEEPDKEGYLKKLKEELYSLKPVKLTLAFEPTDASLDKFFGYVRQNIGEGIILEINYDPSILAGAQVAFEGEYRDFSLKRVYEDEMGRMKEEIISQLGPANYQIPNPKIK